MRNEKANLGEIHELRAANLRLLQQNNDLAQRVRALEENLETAQTKLLLQQQAWYELSKSGKIQIPKATMQSYRLQDTNSVGQSANRPPTQKNSTSGALSAHQEVQKQNAELEEIQNKNVPGLCLKGVQEASNSDIQVGVGKSGMARPLTARPSSARPPTDRLRPKTARAHFGGLLGGEIKMLNTEGKSSAVLHTRFDEHQTDSEGMLRVGAFAARVQVAQREISCAIVQMSEQATSFASLGVHLQCSWAEMELSTKDEPTPNYFRLAVSCWIFDQVCGVVGHYSDLLLKVRRELYTCLFKNFDGHSTLASVQDYSNLLPYFLEYTRLQSERKNHATTIKRLKALADKASKASDDDSVTNASAEER